MAMPETYLGLEVKDWLMVAATALSPVIAVQVSQYLERRRRAADSRTAVFRMLMASRAAGIDDPRHVEALNLIDLEFASDNETDVAIRRAWKAYLNHLTPGPNRVADDAWYREKENLLATLLHEVGKAVGYNIDPTDIKTQIYFPKGYTYRLTETFALRKAALDVLVGNRAIFVAPANIPPPPAAQPAPPNGMVEQPPPPAAPQPPRA